MYYGGIARREGSVPQPEFEKGRAAEAETAMKLAGVEQPRYADYIRLDAGEFSKTDILSLQLLAEYLAGTDYNPKRIAVERNGEIVPKAAYGETILQDGDVIEVVNFVGGG